MPIDSTTPPPEFQCIDCGQSVSSHALRCKLCSAGARQRPMTAEEKREQHRRYMRLYYWKDEGQRRKACERAKKYRDTSEAYRLSLERLHAASAAKQVEPPDVPSEAAAYAAGIIDGEGSIQIRRVRGCNGEVNLTYELFVTVTNTNPKMIAFMHDTFGGAAKSEGRKKARCRQLYRWAVVGERCEWFLHVIRPFLVCKADQVDLANEFRTSFQVRNRDPRGQTSPEVMAFRHSCYLKMKALHRIEWACFEFQRSNLRVGQHHPVFTTVAGK